MRKIVSIVSVFLLLGQLFSFSSTALAEPLQVVINLDKSSVAVGETVKATWTVTGDLAANESLLGFWCTSKEEDSGPVSIDMVGTDSFVPELTGNLFFSILVWNDDDSTFVPYKSKTIPVTKKGTALLGIPSNVGAVSAGYNSIKLSWKAVSGAEGYLIYRAASSLGPYSKIASVTGGSIYDYTNTGLKLGKDYYFKIRAYKKINGTDVYGDYSSVVSAKPSLAKPTHVQAKTFPYHGIKISWEAVPGADGYVIYRATTSTGKYSKIATIDGGKKTSHNNVHLSVGKTYYFKICAFKKVDGSRVFGGYSSVVSTKVE